MSLRDKLRAKTVGSKAQFKHKIVLIDGDEVEVRQPSVRKRSEIMKASGMTDVDNAEGETQPKNKKGTKTKTKADLAYLQVAAVINCTYVPGTEERVFDHADTDALLEQPTGGWFDEIAETALALMNVEAAEDAKNSGKTPSGS